MKASIRTLVFLLLIASSGADAHAQITWDRLGGPLIGPVADLHVTPAGLVYAAGLADDVLFPSVYVSFDGGRSWEETPFAATDGSAAFASNAAGDVLYAAAHRKGGDYDGYAVVAQGKQVLASQALVPAPYDATAVGDTFFVATAQGVLRSRDGRVWHETSLRGRPVYALAAPEAEGPGEEPFARLLASIDEGLFASDDGGRTWALVPAAPPRLYLMETTGARVLAASSEDVWLSLDAGITWSALRAPLHDVAALSFYRGEPVAGAGTSVWHYDTLHATWTKRAALPARVLSLASAQEALLVGAASGAYRGTFEGSFRLTGLPQAAIARMATGADGRMAAVPFGYNLRLSADGGATWAARPVGSTVTALEYDGAGGLYTGTLSPGLLYLAPGDSVWQEAGFADAIVEDIRAGEEGELVVLRSDYVFVRRGAAWQQFASTGPMLSSAAALAPGGRLYVGGTGGMERMRLDGSERTPLTFAGCSGCQVVDIEASDGFAFVLADAHLFRCAHTDAACDRVGTWNSFVRDVAVAADGTVAVALEHGGGVFVSHDEGVTWEEFSDGLPLFTGLNGTLPRSMGPVTFDAEGRLLVSVGETGLHRTQHPVALDVETEYLARAEEHTLSVYPNPAHGPAVRLRWPRPTHGAIRYALFDLLGRRVAGGTLLGEEEVPVDGLSPGFYVLRAEERNGAVAVARFMVY